jgi:integrase
MATFRKRNGKWQVRIQKTSGPSQARTFFTMSDAKLWARKVERNYDLGITEVRLALITLGDAFKRYLIEVSPRKKRPDIERYRIQAWLLHPLSRRILHNLKIQHLSAWRDEQINQGYSSNTIRLHLAVLSHLYTVAQNEWGYEGLKNPVPHLYKPKLPRVRETRMSDNDVDLLISNTQSPYLPSLIRLALLTAMRRSELIKLQWEDIDWSKQLIHLKDTKNGESRQIPIFDKVKVILEGIEGDKGSLFPIKEHAVSVAFRRAVKRSGLENMSFHTLRHEAITRFFEMGLTIPEVASISGHKSWAMLRRYTHLQSETLINKLNL